jgi:hypothetical protein
MNPAAVSYLRGKFGNAGRAQTDEEALASPHALTMDGMLVAGGDIDRLRLVGYHRIGGGSAEQRADLAHKVTSRAQEVARLEGRARAAKEIFELLQPFGGKDSTMARVMAIYGAHSSAQQALDSLTLRLSKTVNAEYVRLGEQEVEWSKRFSEETALLTTHAEGLGSA